MEQQPSIDNPRNYPAEVVDQLGKLLVEGASARQDPRRKNFYDVEHADRTFFIHVSPSSGRVMLLAKWERLLRARSPASRKSLKLRNASSSMESGGGGILGPNAIADLPRWRGKVH